MNIVTFLSLYKQSKDYYKVEVNINSYYYRQQDPHIFTDKISILICLQQNNN